MRELSEMELDYTDEHTLKILTYEANSSLPYIEEVHHSLS